MLNEIWGNPIIRIWESERIMDFLNVIGILMIASVFLGIFIAVALVDSFLVALGVFGVALLLAAFIYMGVHLACR